MNIKKHYKVVIVITVIICLISISVLSITNVKALQYISKMADDTESNILGKVAEKLTEIAISTNLEYRVDLGYEQLDEKEYEEAEVAFKQAIEQNDKDVEAYIGLSETYEQMGETVAAFSILEEANQKTQSVEIEDRLQRAVINNIEYDKPLIQKLTNNYTIDKHYYCMEAIATRDNGLIILGQGDGDDKNKGAKEIYITKLNQKNQVEWTKMYGTSSREYCWSIIEVKDHGYLLAANTDGNDGDNTDGNNGDRDCWVIKIDTNGDIEWNKTYGTSDFDFCTKVIEVKDGGYLLAGLTYGNDGDNTDGNEGQRDCWVIKLDINGEIEWNKTYGTSMDEWCENIIETKIGGYLLTGNIYANNDENEEDNDDYYWALKIDINGEEEWNYTYGTSKKDICRIAIESTDGGYLLAGYTEGSDGDNTDGNNVLADYWLVKLNADGKIEWNRMYGTSSEEKYISGIIPINNSGYLLAGQTSGIDGDNNEDTIMGETDYWILKIDQEGYLQWSKVYGSEKGENVRAFIQKSDDEFILVGLYEEEEEQGFEIVRLQCESKVEELADFAPKYMGGE